MTVLKQKPNRATYRLGVANLALEGLTLSLSEHKLAFRYHAGQITRQEFLALALAHARSR